MNCEVSCVDHLFRKHKVERCLPCRLEDSVASPQSKCFLGGAGGVLCALRSIPFVSGEQQMEASGKI